MLYLRVTGQVFIQNRYIVETHSKNNKDGNTKKWPKNVEAKWIGVVVKNGTVRGWLCEICLCLHWNVPELALVEILGCNSIGNGLAWGCVQLTQGAVGMVHC